MIAIVDSVAKIHLARKATPKTAPIIMDNEMKARLPDGSTMESTAIATLQLTGLSSLVRQIHILTQMHTAPLI